VLAERLNGSVQSTSIMTGRVLTKNPHRSKAPTVRRATNGLPISTVPAPVCRAMTALYSALNMTNGVMPRRLAVPVKASVSAPLSSHSSRSPRNAVSAGRPGLGHST
jgi:hypothetical protein